MRKLSLLFALLISFSSAAWADFHQPWTSKPTPWSSTAVDEASIPSGISTAATNYTVHKGTVSVIKEGETGDATVHFAYSGGGKALRVLGVDLVNSEGVVVKEHFNDQNFGSNNNAFTYTLSGVEAGTYTLRYWICNTSGENISSTNGLITVTGLNTPFITSLEDLRNDKVYTIKSGRSTPSTQHYLLYHTDAPNNLSSTYGSGHPMEYSDAKNNFHFAIYKSGDAYYLFNIAANKFVGNANDNNAAIPVEKVPTNAIALKPSNNADYVWIMSTNDFGGALNAANISNTHGVVNWTGGKDNTTDDGNVYQITEVGDLSTETQTYISNMIAWGPKYWEAYNLSAAAGDQTVRVGDLSAEARNNIGHAAFTFSYTPNETNYNTLISTLEANNIDANKIKLAAGEIFKIKCIESVRGYLAYSTVEGKGSETKAWLAQTNNANHPSLTDVGAYTDFAFIEISGKKYIYNTQNKQLLLKGTPVKFAESGSYVEFIEESSTQFNIKFDGESKYLSFSQGWGADNPVRTEGRIDNGCRFFLLKQGKNVADDVVNAVAEKIRLQYISELQTKLAKVRAKASLRGKGVSQYTYSGNGYVDGKIAAAEAILNNETATAVQLIDAIADLDAILADFSLNMPKVGKLYRLKGYASKKYMAPTAATPSADTKMAMNADMDLPGTIFMFTNGDQVDGQAGYKLWNYSTGYYTKNTHNLGAMANAANSMSIREATSGNPGCYMLHTNTSTSGVGKWIYDNNTQVDRNGEYAAGNCDWTMEEVTWLPIPVSKTYGIGTFYSPANIAITDEYYAKDDRLKFYIGSIENDYLVLTKLEDNIPAKTPVVIEFVGGEYKNNSSYLKIADSADAVEDQNDLRGTLETIAKPAGNIYTLQPATQGAQELTFCLYTGETIKGCKAYLPAAKAVKGIRYNTGGTTGIEGVATEKANKEIFDLSGRRVQNPTSGLYIINGQKVYVK